MIHVLAVHFVNGFFRHAHEGDHRFSVGSEVSFLKKPRRRS
jgi:hypothetical protein